MKLLEKKKKTVKLKYRSDNDYLIIQPNEYWNKSPLKCPYATTKEKYKEVKYMEKVLLAASEAKITLFHVPKRLSISQITTLKKYVH